MTQVWVPQYPSELVFLSVGQGDCAVLRHAGVTVLIDAAPRNEGTDAGARIVAPSLRRMGVRKIDLVLLSHPDADHVGGLGALSKKFSIGAVVIPGSFRNHPDMLKTLEEARVNRVTWINNGWTVKWANLSLHLDSIPIVPGGADNDGSMAVQIRCGQASATFTGDASEAAEEELAKRWDWKAEILHVGHHGSATSTSFTWLREVQPELAVISCGRTNPYGHPAAETLSRLQSLKIKSLRTDTDGTLTFAMTQEGFTLRR